jgi:hypothetical protein
MKKLLLISVLLSIALKGYCQEALINKNSRETFSGFLERTGTDSYPKVNLGLGGGIDYGGFGGRLTILTSPRFEFFGALGYNTLNTGFNAGADFRILPESSVCPYFGMMYGYNSIIKVDYEEQYNHTYFGPSWNIGIELWTRSSPGFFNIELILPLRSAEFRADIRNLKNNPDIVIKGEVLPLSFAIGYHFLLNINR